MICETLSFPTYAKTHSVTFCILTFQFPVDFKNFPEIACVCVQIFVIHSFIALRNVCFEIAVLNPACLSGRSITDICLGKPFHFTSLFVSGKFYSQNLRQIGIEIRHWETQKFYNTIVDAILFQKCILSYALYFSISFLLVFWL